MDATAFQVTPAAAQRVLEPAAASGAAGLASRVAARRPMPGEKRP
ncbi:MAG TPA: hypothetical protein VFZ93_12695 [Albitalea sp.]